MLNNVAAFSIFLSVFMKASLLWMSSIKEFWRDEVNMPRMWASKCFTINSYSCIWEIHFLGLPHALLSLSWIIYLERLKACHPNHDIFPEMTWWEPSRNWRWWGTASAWSPSVVPTWSSQCQQNSTWIILWFCSWLRWDGPPSRHILFTCRLTLNPAALSHFCFTHLSAKESSCACLFLEKGLCDCEWDQGQSQMGEGASLSCPGECNSAHLLSAVIRFKMASAADSFIRLVFPGSPAEGGFGLVGLSSSQGSAVLAASALLWAELPRCHTRGGQSDDALRACVSWDTQANISFPAAWRTVMAAGTLGLTRQMDSQDGLVLSRNRRKKTSFTCSSVLTTYQIVNTEFLSTHHVKSFFFLRWRLKV